MLIWLRSESSLEKFKKKYSTTKSYKTRLNSPNNKNNYKLKPTSFLYFWNNSNKPHKMQFFKMALVIIWFSVSFHFSPGTAIPLMQMNVPSMISPRSVRSNGGQQNVNSGLFTDASPIFKFLLSSGSENYGHNFAKPLSVSANDFENMIRYTYLNNYLGYNMLII